MEWKNLLEETEKAFEKGECYELLTGTGAYKPDVINVPASVPTDWTVLIPLGIHQYYKKNQDESILNQYENAIGKMLAYGETDVWFAAYVLFVQLATEFRGEASFMLNRSIFPLFHQAVEKNREYLASHTYGDETMTMYKDIQRLNGVLKKHYQISMLP